MTAALWLSAIFDEETNSSSAYRGRLALGHHAETDDVSGPLDARDKALADAIRRGDEIAFDAWYTEHFEALWKFAFRFTPSRDAAKDIVQDVFVSLWVRHETFAPQGSLRAYLYGAIRNRALHVLRQSSSAERVFGTEKAKGTFSAGSDAWASSPMETIETRDLHDRLMRLIAQLPERQRTALVMHVEHEMTASEIGRALGVSATAATNLLQRGLSNLRKGLTGVSGVSSQL